MALVAMPMGQSDPTMKHHKHYIDLTEDSDVEPLPPSKRRKSPETRQPQSIFSNASTSVPRQATPVGQTEPTVKSKKTVTSLDGNVPIVRSPFKNRPSWSKFHSKAPTQPNFAKPSLGHSERPNDGLLHSRSTPQNGPATASDPSQREENVRLPSGQAQTSLTPNPAPQRTPVAVLNSSTSRDNSRQPKEVSLTPDGFVSDTLTPESNALTRRTLNSTPLPDRRQKRPTTSIPQSPDKFPPTGASASQISVVIDNSQRTFSQSTTANDFLSRFIQSFPPTGARLSEQAPGTQKPVQSLEYRRRLLVELEKDTSVVYSRASSIEAVFGPHGFSPRYSTDVDKVLRKQLAQPKAKRVRRKKVKLDWSSSKPLVEQPFDPKSLIPPEKQAQDILNSRFDDAFEPPITLINDVNDKQLSGKFQFISSYIRRPGVEAEPCETANYSCDCIGSCRPDSCGCLVDDIEVDDFGDETDHGKIVPYQRVQNTSGNMMSVLRADYMKKSYADGERSEIIECNGNCGCGADCWNRVVQKGRTLPLEIFMTTKCGFGIRSPQDIIKGQFIDLYLGEVITETELDSRELATDGAPSYIFSLDWFQLKDVYYVDSLNFGTPTRFLNHSCNPNCRVFTVILNRADKKVYGLAFFATRDIPAGTELNIDYNPQEAGKTYPKPKPGDDDGVVLCHCGAQNCRVRLWPGPKMKKGKGWAMN